MYILSLFASTYNHTWCLRPVTDVISVHRNLFWKNVLSKYVNYGHFSPLHCIKLVLQNMSEINILVSRVWLAAKNWNTPVTTLSISSPCFKPVGHNKKGKGTKDKYELHTIGKCRGWNDLFTKVTLTLKLTDRTLPLGTCNEQMLSMWAKLILKYI